jgi:hypothetical protein
VQKTLRATAEIKLDRDVQDKLQASAKVADVTGEIKDGPRPFSVTTTVLASAGLAVSSADWTPSALSR